MKHKTNTYMINYEVDNFRPVLPLHPVMISKPTELLKTSSLDGFGEVSSR